MDSFLWRVTCFAKKHASEHGHLFAEVSCSSLFAWRFDAFGGMVYCLQKIL